MIQQACRQAAVIVALAALAAGASLAQGPGGFFMGGGPGRMMGGAGNPAVSNLMGLLQRPEVQNEIHLSLKQKNALEDLQTSSRGEMRQRMMQMFQQMQGLSPEERQARMQEMQGQIQSQVAQFQGELSDKVKALLNPDQVKRLQQLDLQWRGPLALADPKVAEAVKLSPEHRDAVRSIYAQYNAQVQQITAQFAQQMRESGGLQRRPFNPQENGADPNGMRNRFMELQNKILAAKKDAEQKVMNALSPEERQAWTDVQGPKFTFRKVLEAMPGRGPAG